MSQVLECDYDIQKWEGYITNLEAENFENDLYHVVKNEGLGDLGLLRSCLYTDSDNIWEHSTMQFVLVISNHKKKLIKLTPII